MTQVSAEHVKELREKTGAGILDCRKALTETSGNMENAVDWLRKKGLSAAAKKSGRVAAEGLIAVAVEGPKGAIIELNSETDFVAKNDQFQKLAASIAEFAVHQNIGDVEKLKDAKCPKTGKSISEQVTGAIATIGENITLRRSAALSVNKGVVASYVHSAAAPGLGKIGVLVALESEADAGKLEALGKQIAMHIAAARPDATRKEEVSTQMLDRERDVYREQAKASGKPADVIEKMIEGRIRKYYEEVVLLEQLFVVDGKSKVSDVVAAAAKEAGKPIEVKGFIRLQVGEGIEKKEDDFAAEVAKVAGAK
ncbi:MAG: translation elongation factor Ts [Alphaproteobacteria bacterium]